jgi:hypothetical protein
MIGYTQRCNFLKPIGLSKTSVEATGDLLSGYAWLHPLLAISVTALSDRHILRNSLGVQHSTYSHIFLLAAPIKHLE